MGDVWILDADSDLQLRLCVIAHTGLSGIAVAIRLSEFFENRIFGLLQRPISGPCAGLSPLSINNWREKGSPPIRSGHFQKRG